MDFGELLLGMHVMLNEKTDKKAAYIFDSLDKKKKGSLDADEMKRPCVHIVRRMIAAANARILNGFREAKQNAFPRSQEETQAGLNMATFRKVVELIDENKYIDKFHSKV